MKMPLAQYNLSSKAYRSTVFTGFSRLQQEEEFVDLTLAADGCFCKVHRSIIALASPYLRGILRNLQGNAPVIYLNKIRKEILEYILEYIYQGDVNIPVQLLAEFIEVSKSLHIAGIADLEPPKVLPDADKSSRKYAKKRKLERIPNIEVSKTTDCTNLIQMCESATTSNVYNDGNEDYCMEDQNKSSNDFQLPSHNTDHDQESNKLDIVINSNKDLITFHTRKEQHNPSIHIENSQMLEIPTDTTPDLLIDQSCIDQSYKIIVKPGKETTEASETIPLIEIQPCPSQEDNSIIFGPSNKLAILANTTPDNNKVDLPIFEIIGNDIIKSVETDCVRHSEVSQSMVDSQTVTIADQNNEGNLKPGWKVITNDVVKSVKECYVTQSSQVSQPLFEIGSIPDQDNRGKFKPIIKIVDNDLIRSVEADYDTPALQISEPPTHSTFNRDQNNVEKSLPVINILSNNDGMETDVGVTSLKATLNDMKNMAQYSITERGALQLILNRFIYCSHGNSSKKRRWRCINYRREACPALVDTSADGAIVHRKGIHGHEFHDKKIFNKHKSGLIFSTMALATIARNSREKEGTNVVSFDETDDGDD